MKTIQIVMVVICLIGGSWLAARIQQQEQPKQKRPVTRAKRPQFDKKDWNGVFFEDIFSEGLSGKRPGMRDPNAVAGSQPATTGDSTTDVSGGWAALIEGSVLENEVKRWQQDLADKVTSPGKYKTSHSEIGEQFSMLAMWFAIIGQYESDVRWTEDADSARAAFLDAARKSRDTDMSAFRNVQRRTEDLTELVRGGKFPAEPGAKSEISDWSSIVDRAPIMARLEQSVSEELKLSTASEKDFKASVDQVMHEAGLIAALGRVLQMPEMLDADDDEYNAFAQEMMSAALGMKMAAKTKNLDGVNQALNRINQSCTNCHGEFR